MGVLAGFGAGGLIATNYGLDTLVGLGVAAFGGLVMAVALWLLIGKLLRLRIQSRDLGFRCR